MARGTVKFFNSNKGFGFIGPEDGSSDVFVHVSAVERSGLDELGEGDQVSFDVEQDRRSGKLGASNIRLISKGNGASSRPSAAPRRDAPRPMGGAQTRTSGQIEGGGRGTVKWFNPTKGFGFIAPEDGTADIFVHISAVERSGLRELREGQIISFQVERDRSGKTAAVNLALDD